MRLRLYGELAVASVAAVLRHIVRRSLHRGLTSPVDSVAEGHGEDILNPVDRAPSHRSVLMDTERVDQNKERTRTHDRDNARGTSDW